jgi:hypothetical protein
VLNADGDPRVLKDDPAIYLRHPHIRRGSVSAAELPFPVLPSGRPWKDSLVEREEGVHVVLPSGTDRRQMLQRHHTELIYPSRNAVSTTPASRAAVSPG